jgi:hypothetical protein
MLRWTLEGECQRKGQYENGYPQRVTDDDALDNLLLLLDRPKRISQESTERNAHLADDIFDHGPDLVDDAALLLALARILDAYARQKLAGARLEHILAFLVVAEREVEAILQYKRAYRVTLVQQARRARWS